VTSHEDQLDTDTLAGADRIGHLLWETSSRVSLMAELLIGDIQLSLASIGALERIAAEPGTTSSQLARRAFKTQQAVSQVTSRLERLGYIERQLGKGRGVGLYTTRLGIAALADGSAREAEIDVRLQEMLGADDAERLRLLLGSLRQALVEVAG
jgi:DNA-binding MarR family transcriptional regulator